MLRDCWRWVDCDAITASLVASSPSTVAIHINYIGRSRFHDQIKYRIIGAGIDPKVGQLSCSHSPFRFTHFPIFTWLSVFFSLLFFFASFFPLKGQQSATSETINCKKCYWFQKEKKVNLKPVIDVGRHFVLSAGASSANTSDALKEHWKRFFYEWLLCSRHISKKQLCWRAIVKSIASTLTSYYTEHTNAQTNAQDV